MITLRLAGDRGRTQIDWLDSWHSFSFGEYYDPRQMGFRSLRVINDDRVAPGMGFGEHPHRDMEIFTYVLKGALEHRDSLGSGSVIRPGDVQIMSAGTGIRHSEFNPSRDEPVHLLQVWVMPERKGLPPRYDERRFTVEERRGRLCLLASRDAGEAAAGVGNAAAAAGTTRGEASGPVVIYQDARVYATILGAGERVRHEVPAGRYGWLHVARGALNLGDLELHEGDGAALTGPEAITLIGRGGEAEALVFDLG